MADRRSAAGLAGGLAIVAALTAIDVAAGPSRHITATVLLGPFLAAMLCSVRATGGVAAVAAAMALLSPLWTDDTSYTHAIRVGAVLAGSALSVLAARERVRSEERRRRLEVLGAVAEVSDGRLGLRATAERIADLVVPAIADVCTIDVVRGERSERLVARVAGAGREPPELPIAVDDERMLREHGDGWTIAVPLRSRGRRIGSLGLDTRASKRVLGAPDLEFARILAGRVALALDNAGLSAELEEAERRLGVALDALASAVLIQRPGQGIVYANQAAADQFGLPDPAAVVAATPEQIAGEWVARHEDGRPLLPADFPSRRILTGVELHPPTLYTYGIHRRTGREAWFAVKAVPVLDEDGEVEMAVSVTEDVTEVRRAARTQRLLAESGRLLGEGGEEALQAVADLLVPDLADWSAITVPAEDGTLRTVAAGHEDRELLADVLDFDRRRPARAGDTAPGSAVLRDGRAVLVEDLGPAAEEAIPDPERRALAMRLGLRSIAYAPLTPPGSDPIGVLNLAHSTSGRRFAPADLAVIEELARRLAVAMQHARIYEERSRTAAILQDSLLPDDLPAVPGHELAASYRPAGRGTWVGGDFYDAVETPGGWMLVVGDVAGQGPAAAALTAQARHTLRTAGALTGDLAATAAHLNATLAAKRPSALCTACLVLLGPGGRAQVLCAGHPRPVLVRDGRAEEVGEWGPVLGAFADAALRPVEVELRAGDLLVLYTDGVLDASGTAERFGHERLHATLAGARGAEEAVRAVEAALDAFQVGRQADDTALLACRRA